MRFFEVIGETKELKRYEPAVFAIMRDGAPPDDYYVIYSQSPSLGEFRRSDLTIEKLYDHLEKMEREGFTVRELTHCLSR